MVTYKYIDKLLNICYNNPLCIDYNGGDDCYLTPNHMFTCPSAQSHYHDSESTSL